MMGSWLPPVALLFVSVAQRSNRAITLVLAATTPCSPWWMVMSNSGTTLVSGARSASTQSIPVEAVSTLTHFPEILDGLVKTLHPAILGGILARRDMPEHMKELQAHNITPIDIVVANLYPFAETVTRPTTTRTEAQKQIDVG